jgi:uncharacterized lipoprotein
MGDKTDNGRLGAFEEQSKLRRPTTPTLPSLSAVRTYRPCHNNAMQMERGNQEDANQLIAEEELSMEEAGAELEREPEKMKKTETRWIKKKKSGEMTQREMWKNLKMKKRKKKKVGTDKQDIT